MALRRDVQSAAMNLKDRLSIEIQPDMRHGRVTYGGHVFNAKVGPEKMTVLNSTKMNLTDNDNVVNLL